MESQTCVGLCHSLQLLEGLDMAWRVIDTLVSSRVEDPLFVRVACPKGGACPKGLSGTDGGIVAPIVQGWRQAWARQGSSSLYADLKLQRVGRRGRRHNQARTVVFTPMHARTYTGTYIL